MCTIGYLGPRGSFSEEALHFFLANNPELNVSPPELVPFPSIPQLLLACDRQEVSSAFVPLENSTEGQVGVTMDTLGQTEHISIIQEFIHPIEQCLLTKAPLPLSAIEKIFSHEQALGQCREFIAKNLAQSEQVICSSTADAASRITTGPETWAAIGSNRAASLYNLHCMTSSIQDSALNATRFILVGSTLAELSGDDKTSLFVVTDNSPGSLYRILHEFAIRNINLSRIESRPSKQKLGEYVFFVDLDGYVFSPPIQDVLWALKEMQVTIKLLGSYPKAHPVNSFN